MHQLNLSQLPLQGSALIEASAGTGKTFTIAALYLRAVLGHGLPQPLLPADILVMTFTEAATSELTERIRQRLSEAAAWFSASGSASDPVLSELAQAFAQEHWPRCAQRLALAAQSMDDAAISTIHGWCHRMLTEYAFASGSHFEDSLTPDQTDLKQEVAEDYWRSFVYDFDVPTLLRWQRRFATPTALRLALAPIWQESPLQQSLAPAQLIQQEQLQRQQLLAQLKAPWPGWIAELELLFAKLREAKVLNGSKLRQDYQQKWFAAILAWAQDPTAVMLDIGAGSTRLTPEGMADACKGAAPDHPAFVAMSKLMAALEQLPDCSEALRQHALRWCQQRFMQRQQESGCFGFDDMLKRLQQALSGPQRDTLAQRIRQQFPLVLIDEFQDTDPVQYHIFNQVYQLADNRQDCGILLIGDPKQAIYAFRGADIYTYLQAKQATVPRHYSLDTNYRSSQAMVESVNRIFLSAEQRSSGLGAFLFRQQQNLIQFTPVKAKGRSQQWLRQQQPMPALELVVLDPSNQTDAKPLSKEAYTKQMAQHCAQQIAKFLYEGQQGFNGFAAGAPESHSAVLQPLQPQDIAVLVHNQQEANVIRQALLQHGVRSVYLSDRGSVFTSVVAADLLLWLEACADPQHELKVRSALASPTLGWDYATLARLQQDEWFLEFWLTEFQSFQQLWQRQGVLPLVRHLLNRFQLIQQFAQRAEGERQLTDLLHLAELLQQASRMLEGEQALLRYFKAHLSGEGDIDAQMLKLRLESDEDLVRVVTIHKSKGLEYPLVFLPFIANAKSLNKADLPYRYHDANQQLQLCYQGQEQHYQQAERERLGEDLRKLYVALTRSQYYCYVGLAALKEASAIAYLLTEQGQFQPGQMEAQLAAFASPAVKISACQIALDAQGNTFLSTGAVKANAPSLKGQYAVMPKRPSYRWFVASYSGLAEGAGSAALPAQQADPAQNTLAAEGVFQELHQELQQEQSSAEGVVSSGMEHKIAQLFIRGAEAGTWLHDALQFAADHGFAKVVQDPNAFLQYIIQRSSRQGWLWQQPDGWWQRRLLRTDGEQPERFISAEQALMPLLHWLLQLIQAPWLCQQQFCSLATLSGYQAEMEFLIAAQQVDTQQLDRLVQQALWPGLARPALQPRQVHGMLKGFIDLTFFAEGRYHVADYKSNYIEEGLYDSASLVSIMLSKRYDLQAALYALALHRLLRSRLANYNIQQHLGHAYYWFVRGCQQPVAGVATPADHQGMLEVQIAPSLVLALDELFQGQLQQESA